MTAIKDLFKLHRAKSGLFSDYELGDVAYVGNSLVDNAVVGYVSPLTKDKVFRVSGNRRFRHSVRRRSNCRPS